jgi:UDP-MurNAc hydroxylase
VVVKKMIKVTYYYSACVAITTPDVSILCDPWFTDGIYDGAWYQYPKIKNPIELIGKHDIIYVSHIHPDHYDPVFLKEYLKVYPDTNVMVAEGVFLDKKMKADNIRHRVSPYQAVGYYGRTNTLIINNDSDSCSDIDTALIVKYEDECSKSVVVNMNDNQYNQNQIDKIKKFAPNIDIALLGYTGAGPYPQTYYKDHEILAEKAQEKKDEFFWRYAKMADELGAKVNIPFAGQYILGGRLSHMNKWRGVADATEVYNFDQKAIVLAEGGSINTKTLKPTKARIDAYDVKEMYAYAASLTIPMNYMKDFKYLASDCIQWGRLLSKSYHNAMDKLEYEGDSYKIVIKMPNNKYFYMHLNKNKRDCYMQTELLSGMKNYSLIEVDYRYLFGLITGVYHWNNAEVGSQYMTTRVPDEYNRSVQRFLNFFVV